MSPGAPLRTSVVIAVLDAQRVLPLCLAALDGLDPAPDEIILVDNGSTDGSLEIMRGWVAQRDGAVLLQEPRRGASAARNRGCAAAGGELIAFTDSDCVPRPDWLRSLTAPLRDAEVGAVAGAVVPAAFDGALETFNGLYTLRSPEGAGRHTRLTAWAGGFPTANLAIRKQLFERIGGFDESIGIYGEDFDLCARVYGDGKQIAYDSAARVAHHHRVTLRGMVRQAFGFGRSHAYLMRRRHLRGLWLQLPGRSVSFERAPVSAWIDLAGADKKLIVSALMGLLYAPLFALPPLYFGWLTLRAHQRARAAGLQPGPAREVALAGLLLLKSASMTAGRIWGSLRYGVLCF